MKTASPNKKLVDPWKPGDLVYYFDDDSYGIVAKVGDEYCIVWLSTGFCGVEPEDEESELFKTLEDLMDYMDGTVLYKGPPIEVNN